MTASADVARDSLTAHREITAHLETGILPFWLGNGVDREHGGYLTAFDAQGHPTGDTDKSIVSETRMIWGFSALAQSYPARPELVEAARQGVDFFLGHFWDREFGGWVWKVARDGARLDDGKVVFGQCYAIYALAEYSLATGDPRDLEHAERIFDLLQVYAADTRYGGYYENLERDWRLSEPGLAAGDRKSLDTHLHLMEAFTVLAKASGREIHRRRLEEVIDVILARMIHPENGSGRSQLALDFTPIPAINFRRTWNAARNAREVIEVPADTTSYGHNLELAWLLNRAGEVLGRPFHHFDHATRRLVDHSLRYGFDTDLGGVYRDGLHDREALVLDKEWWQNTEALVGYLDAYEHFGDRRYFDAFWSTWRFAHRCFINHEVGEWRQLLTRDGRVLLGDIGNWRKAIYHTGRSMLECKQRLERLSA